MTYCTHCNAWYPDGISFCPNCGKPLVNALPAQPPIGNGYMAYQAPLTNGAGSVVYISRAPQQPEVAATAPTGEAVEPADASPQIEDMAKNEAPMPAKRRPENGEPEHGGPAMLKLKDIKKDYKIASGSVPALKGVSLEFRKSEFVCILGQSGCGKTTMLNIIGGLDH